MLRFEYIAHLCGSVWDEEIYSIIVLLWLGGGIGLTHSI